MIGGCRFCAWCLLKVTYGLLFVAAGLDKFFNFIAPWEKFVSPMLLKYLPLEVSTIIHGVGVLEIALGVVILAVSTRYGALAAAAWLLAIAANLFTMGYPYDIAVRDVVLAVGALALAKLTFDSEGENCTCRAGKK